MQVPFVVLFGSMHPRIYLPLFIFVFVHFLHHLIIMAPSLLVHVTYSICVLTGLYHDSQVWTHLFIVSHYVCSLRIVDQLDV